MVHNKIGGNIAILNLLNEFDKKGNPKSFEYYDVHSRDYINALVNSINPKQK